MTFIEAFKDFFVHVFDLTGYITITSLVVSLFLIIYKKPKNIYYLLLMIFVSIIGGGVILLLEALFFGITRLGLLSPKYNGLLFSLSMCLVTCIFIYWTYRKNRINQLLIKLSTIIASIFIFNTMSKSFGIFAGLLSHDNFYLVVFCRSLPYLLLIFTVFVIKKIDINHFKTLSNELSIGLYDTNLILVIIAIFDSTMSEHGLNINILLSITSLALYSLMILLYYAMYKVNEYRHEAINHEVQSKLATARLKSLTIDKVNREEISKIKHDIKNQINYIGLLLEQQKYSEATAYVNDYLDKNSETLNTFVSPNEVINSIINLELTKAKAYNIKIKAKAPVPSYLPFKDIDLCSLITNILDNAIENCDPGKENPIVISIFKQRDFIRIYCENTIKNKANHNENISTKKEKGHGYGLKIIKNIAESYGGYAYFETKDDKFITDVLLELGEGMKNV